MKDVKINPINIIRFKLNNKPTRNICHNLIVIYKFTTELYPFKYNKFNCLNNHYSLVISQIVNDIPKRMILVLMM